MDDLKDDLNDLEKLLKIHEDIKIYNSSFDELKDFIKKEFDDNKVYQKEEYQEKLYEKGQELMNTYWGEYEWVKVAKFARDTFLISLMRINYGNLTGKELKERLMKDIEGIEEGINEGVSYFKEKGREMEVTLKKYVLRYALYQYDKLYREKGKKKWSKGEVIKLLKSYSPASDIEKRFVERVNYTKDAYISSIGAKSRKEFRENVANFIENFVDSEMKLENITLMLKGLEGKINKEEEKVKDFLSN